MSMFYKSFRVSIQVCKAFFIRNWSLSNIRDFPYGALHARSPNGVIVSAGKLQFVANDFIEVYCADGLVGSALWVFEDNLVTR